MNSLDAVERVLVEVGHPLHYKEITKRILKLNIWETSGETPDRTINAQISVDMKRHGELSRFVRTSSATYALRKWGVKEQYSFQNSVDKEEAKLSFTDAAEYILENCAEKNPLHYREITEKILELNLVETEGKTPEATLYSLILTEIKRQTDKGKMPRFVKYGRGMIGLRSWLGKGLAYSIEQHNRDIEKKLQSKLYELSPQEFEQLVGRLLGEMGFEEIEVTSYGNDGGVDVRGTLVVGDVVRTKMAVQAKRWKGHNVGSTVVQQVRGSLGAHEQGMIITTSGFSKGAIIEAERADAVPVALVGGDQLVGLLIEHQVLVKKIPYELIYLEGDF